MTQPEATTPNFILIDPPKRREPAAEALEALTWETPASEITPDMSPELSRLMSRMFQEF